MKKNANILEKLRIKEYRAGIDRITVESDTFKRVRILYFITLAINLIMNLLYCVSLSYTTDELLSQAGGFSNLSVAMQDEIASNRTSVIFVAVMSLALIAGLVLLIKKLHIPALILNAVPAIALIIHLGIRAVESSLYVSLWKNPFLYQFAIPLTITLGLAAWYCIVGIIHDYGENKAYNDFVAKLYTAHADRFDKLTDEEWEKFLSEYNYERPQDKINKRKGKSED